MRRLALAGAALVILGGCGLNPTSGESSGTGPATKVTVTVKTDADAKPRVMKLECDPVGGDHPNAEAACAALAKAAPKIFAPLPKDQVCTMIYGGPQTATIEGTYDGEAVDAAFDRANGCEIDRWDKLGTEVFDVPLQ